MDIFIGTIDAKTDAKGRAYLPVSFRKILQTAGESHLILRQDVYKSCLILYPENVWTDELINLRARLNRWDEQEQELFRQISYLVENLELDSSGRILIPKKYLLAANISNTICFHGVDHTIELWNPELLAKSMLNLEDYKSRVQKMLGSKPAL